MPIQNLPVFFNSASVTVQTYQQIELVLDVSSTRAIASGGVSGAMPFKMSIFSWGSALAVLPTHRAQTLRPIDLLRLDDADAGFGWI